MKKLGILFILGGLALQAVAQNNVTGRVVSADNEDIIYRIELRYANDSLKNITGSFYEPDFAFAVDSVGEVQLTFSADGYEPSVVTKTLQTGRNDVGEIALYRRNIQLQEVVVRAKKNEIVKDGPNYTIRNVQGTHIGDAGNLQDMLKWTPGVMVSSTGDIRVAGAGSPLIYINERQVKDLSELEVLSSTDVNSIEIIREPDARYKNGTQAVVIIHLKKQLKDFLGASISNSFTLRRRYAENPRINLTGKSGIVSGNLSFSYNRVANRSYDAYETTIQHSENDIFRNSSDGGFGAESNRYTVFGGLNFTFSPKHTLGVQYTGNFRNADTYTDHDLLLDDNGQQTRKKEASDGTDEGKSHSVSASYVWNRNDHSALTLIADYATQHNETGKEVEETNLNTGTTYLTPTLNYSDYDIYTFNGNYSFRLGHKDTERIGVEAGYTQNNSGTRIDQALQNLDRQNKWLAAFWTYQQTWGKVGVTLGLRYEYDYTHTKSTESGTPTTLRKTYSDFFPNARISYTPNDRASYSLSYRRTIGRPTFSQLSPIVNYEDSLHYWTGNPLLEPTFTNTFSFTANWAALTFRANYYYRKNPIVSIYGHGEENPNILVQRPENIDHSQEWDVGLEYALSHKSLYLSAFGYFTGAYIKYPYLGEITSYQNYYTNLGIYISYGFGKHFEVYANTYYTSPWRDGTQKIGYMLDTNVGVSGRFCKNKLYVAVEGQDLFAKSTTPWWENNYGDTSYWRRNRYDTRGVNLTVRYTFNAVKTNFKSRSGNQQLLRRAD